MSALPEYLQHLHEQLHQKRTKKSAWIIVEEYLSFFSVAGVNKDLWQMLLIK